MNSRRLLAAVAVAGLAIAGCSAGSAAGGGSSPSPATGSAPASGSAGSGSAAAGSALAWRACPQVAPPALREPAGAAELRPARTAGRSPWRCPRCPPPPRPASGRACCWSTPADPGGGGPEPGRGRRRGAQPGRGGRVRHHRLRHPRHRRVGAGAALRPGVLRHGPAATTCPASRAAEQVLVGRARTYAADCQRRFGWLLPYMTTRDIARDLDSIRVALGPAADQLLRLLLRHLPRPGLRHACSRAGCGAWCWTARWTRTGVWYADNFGQDYAFQGRIDGVLRAGRPATTRPTGWAPPPPR